MKEEILEHIQHVDDSNLNNLKEGAIISTTKVKVTKQIKATPELIKMIKEGKVKVDIEKI